MSDAIFALNIIGFVFFFVISGCSKDESNSQLELITIHGIVLDAVLNRPMSEVSVISELQNTVTKAGGTYELSFTGVPGAAYTVTFKRSGYLSHTQKIILQKDMNINVRLELKTVNGKISGHAFINEKQTAPGSELQSYRSPAVVKYVDFSVLNNAFPTYGEDEFIVFVDPSMQDKVIGILHNKNAKFRISDNIDALVVQDATEKELNLWLKPYVQAIAPNFSSVRLQGEPTDPYYVQQWHFPLAGFPQAWESTKGDNSIIVAVLDSGVMENHPDLVHALVPGWDFVENDSVPQDTNGHGTFVAGIIAAAMDNGQGGVGAAPKVKVMPVRIFENGQTTNERILQGFNYAVTHGANVINMSFGSKSAIPLFYSELKDAYNQGIVLVAAAGNEGGQVLYPAAHDEVIAVGAVDSTGNRPDYSNYGYGLDLMAPGGSKEKGVYSTALINGQADYGYSSGTSFAAPHVAGLAALLMSIGVKSPAEIFQRLINSTTEVGTPGEDWFSGYGLIDAGAALNYQTSEGIKVFLGKVDGQKIEAKSYLAITDSEGAYEITRIQPGEWNLIGWLDNNYNKKIDKGDYYGLGSLIDYTAITDGYYPTYKAVNIALKSFLGSDILIQNLDN